MTVLMNTLVVVATVIGMEAVAWAAHRYLMHGPGWGWHRSHHEPHDELLEKNDLYALVFAGITLALLFFASQGSGIVYWAGVGMSLYGCLYFFVHDGLVHQRWPFRYVPKHGYLKRLVQAHRLHHAVEGREGAVSFGFLYAPPVKRLREELRARQGRDLRTRSRAPGEHPHAPHAEVPAAGRPRSTHERGASFEAPLRGAPQDEDGGGLRAAPSRGLGG